MRIPPPTSAGLMLSYKCTAECRHCIYACSPKWESDWISKEDIEELFAMLARWITPSPRGPGEIGVNDGLHFSGGEPFLNFELLLEATQIAERLSIPSTFVETNCYWCVTDEIARERLRALKQAGLKGILISVNPFYTEYIPFERTERCIRISQEVFGTNVIVYQMAYYRRFKELGIKDRLPFETYIAMSRQEFFEDQVEMFLMGRAARRLREFYPGHSAQAFFGMPCRPPFLRDWHNHFDNYGNYIPGFCGGISLGHWRNMESMIQDGITTKDHPILNFLLNEDMEGLFHFAQDFGYPKALDGYISKCDLCLALRAFLATQNAFAELAPQTFYERLQAEQVAAHCSP